MRGKLADNRMDTRWWYESLPTFPTYRQYVPIAEESKPLPLL